MKKVEAPAHETFARIRVIGVGGSGKNVTNHMVKVGIPGVEFIAANTDAQDLQHSKAERKIHLGKRATKGLGTGMNPTLGKTAGEESLTEINDALKGSDLVFIACGMGGGTGTGAAPIIAKAAKNLDILTIAVVTRPFTFEGGKRREVADAGLDELARCTDAMVIIPNDNILATADDKMTMSDAFTLSDNVLLQAVSGISQLIIKPGDINIDFADIRTIMENSGTSLLGLGNGRGTNKADMAVTRAISSPLLDTSIKGARRVLFSIASRARSEVSMKEVKTIADRITESVDPSAKIIFGTSTDKDLKQGEVRVTLIATDFDEDTPKQQEPNRKKEEKLEKPIEEKKIPERLSEFTIEDSSLENEIILSDDQELYSEEEEQVPAWKKIWNRK